MIPVVILCDSLVNWELNLSVSDSLTVQAPMTDISRMNTDDDLGFGAGVILDEIDVNEYFVYVKHTGILSSDGITAANTSSDYVLVGNGDSDAASQIIKLYPGEFCWMTLAPAGDGSDDGVEVGGIKVAAGSAAVQINYAYWKRS